MEEQEIIEKAMKILESRLKKPTEYFTSCARDVMKFLALKSGELEYECFCVMYMDGK